MVTQSVWIKGAHASWHARMWHCRFQDVQDVMREFDGEADALFQNRKAKTLWKIRASKVNAEEYGD